jgi:hypothetical protein
MKIPKIASPSKILDPPLSWNQLYMQIQMPTAKKEDEKEKYPVNDGIGRKSSVFTNLNRMFN